MKQHYILAFVGMPGSGKGTCSDYLSQKYGWPVVHFGNMVYEEVAKRGLHNTEDEKFVRSDMRQQEGPAVLAKRAAARADELVAAGDSVVLFDGLYSWSEYRFLEEKFGTLFITIATAAPKKLRRQRVLDRKDSHRSYNLELITAREIDEIEHLEKGGPIAYADFTIVNNTNSLNDLYESLEQILSELKIT